MILRLARRIAVRLEAPKAPDFALIRRLAECCFPIPVDLFGPDVDQRHYDPDWMAQHHQHRLQAAVARDPAGLVVGYAYYQLRPEGEVYVRELAANPPTAATRVPLVGTVLLSFVLEEALSRGCARRATLNILREHRRPVFDRRDGTIWRDPVGFYSRFGFSIEDSPGYLASGEPRDLADTWMVANVAHSLASLVSLARGKLGLPSEGNVSGNAEVGDEVPGIDSDSVPIHS